MRILAIETSSKTVSVALLDQTQVILELDSRHQSGEESAQNTRLAAGNDDQLPPGYVRKRSKGKTRSSRIFPPGASVLLAPMIQSLFHQTATSLASVELIAVTIGPGSFTGLRVGVVTAKSLAYSTGIEIIGVNTLDAIADQTAECLDNANHSMAKRICPIVNAQRQQVFAGWFAVADPASNQIVRAVFPNQIYDHQAWIDQIQPGDLVTGPALKAILPKHPELNASCHVAPESKWDCTATAVGKLAWKQFESGERHDLWKLEPLYFRPSAAEEARNAKIV